MIVTCLSVALSLIKALGKGILKAEVAKLCSDGIAMGAESEIPRVTAFAEFLY